MLRVNQLAGLSAGAASMPQTPATLSFIGGTEDPGNNTTYTFASVAIGAADATRRVVVVAHWSRATAVVALTSATIGGIAATIHVQDGGAGVGGRVAIISALVPTGTTATIALNFSTAQDRAFIAVYRAINETSAGPTATASDNAVSGNQFDVSLNIPSNGWVVAGVNANQSGSGMVWSWLGITEQYDAPYSDAAAVSRSGGFDTGLASQAGRFAIATGSATPAGGGLCAMSWG
jgi:hypothetical protein